MTPEEIEKFFNRTDRPRFSRVPPHHRLHKNSQVSGILKLYELSNLYSEERPFEPSMEMVFWGQQVQNMKPLSWDDLEILYHCGVKYWPDSQHFYFDSE